MKSVRVSRILVVVIALFCCVGTLAFSSTTHASARGCSYDQPTILRVQSKLPVAGALRRLGCAVAPISKTSGIVGHFDPVARLVATEAASVPGAGQLADEVAGATGGTVKELSNGYSVTVPNGSRGIVVRVMEEGGGRTNYYRVSVPGKEAFTVDGIASVDRALTHIGISNSSLDEILRIIKAAGG